MEKIYKNLAKKIIKAKDGACLKCRRKFSYIKFFSAVKPEVNCAGIPMCADCFNDVDSAEIFYHNYLASIGMEDLYLNNIKEEK